MSERCQGCGYVYSEVYRVPDAVWERITNKPPDGGLLCLGCADIRAKMFGFQLYWTATVGDWTPGETRAAASAAADSPKDQT